MTSSAERIQQADAAAATTVYVVLKDSPGGAWKKIAADVTARDANSAIRATVADLAEDDQAGTFVAVPARSWRPVKVSAKVERTLVVEDAGA